MSRKSKLATTPSRLALCMALAAGVGAATPAEAKTVAVDAAVLEQLQQIIKQQQGQLQKQSKQLETQSKTLRSLQTQVESIQKTTAATATAPRSRERVRRTAVGGAKARRSSVEMRRFGDGTSPDAPTRVRAATIRCALPKTPPRILRRDRLTSIWCRCTHGPVFEKALELRADSQIDIKQNRLLELDFPRGPSSW